MKTDCQKKGTGGVYFFQNYLSLADRETYHSPTKSHKHIDQKGIFWACPKNVKIFPKESVLTKKMFFYVKKDELRLTGVVMIPQNGSEAGLAGSAFDIRHR